MEEYDPNKQYTWPNDATFVMTGKEFGYILNTLRAILSTETAMQILLAERSADIMEAKVAKAVTAGVATEVEPEKTQ